MNTKNLIMTGATLFLLIGGFLLLNNDSKNNTQETTIVTSTPSSSPVSSDSAKIENKVTVTKNGFEPKTLKVKRGTTVIWENKSGGMANVSSDPHPTHTLFPFLNLRGFQDESMVSALFEKVGIYTYHNHLEPLETGTIIVE